MTYTYQRARISLGDFYDFDEPVTIHDKKLRITNKGIVQVQKYRNTPLVSEELEPAAHLDFDLGGGVAICSDPATKVGVNEFHVPIRPSRDPEAAVVHFYADNRFFSFFKCCVLHINAHSGEIEVEISQAHAKKIPE